MRNRPVYVYMAIILFVIGFLAVIQLRTQTRIREADQARSTSDQGVIISKLIDANAALRNEIADLQKKIAEYDVASSGAHLETLVADLNRIRILNGTVETTGPGIRVVIVGDVKVTDLQDVVNELRNAGAEAICMNGQRIVAHSIITQDRESIIANNARIYQPFILEAIGDADTLQRAMQRKGGLLELIRYNSPNVIVSLSKEERLVLPMYQGKYSPIYAKPAEK